mmetsp:Transcript_72224/g.169080  ORF Transcript_72224/g.169080 Transcript_72224/m.169080 type:complete len:262 (-) Transcript_72224:41-826(-)
MWWVFLLLLAAPASVEAGLKLPYSRSVDEFLNSPEFLNEITKANLRVPQEAKTLEEQMKKRELITNATLVTRMMLHRVFPAKVTLSRPMQETILFIFGRMMNGTRVIYRSDLPSNVRRLGSVEGPIGNETFQFHSFDSEQKKGTGILGSDGMNDSVSEVTVVRDHEGGLSFTIGPPIAGHFLIGGTMEIQERDQGRLAGKIRAAFVNLRTTLTGTWEATSSDLHSELHIHLTEIGLQEDWTWKPENYTKSSVAVNGTHDGK